MAIGHRWLSVSSFSWACSGIFVGSSAVQFSGGAGVVGVNHTMMRCDPAV